MSLILGLLMYFIVSFSGSVPDGDRYYLCNGLEINNTDSAAVSEYADMWIIHFSFDDSLTYVVIFDTCWEARSYKISPSGIEQTEF